MSMPTAADLATCVFCPKLCRHVCPVAVGTAREAAVPSNMAMQPFRFLEGQGDVQLATGAAALCVQCGACTDHCDVDRPLGDLLAQVLAATSAPPQPQPLRPIEGTGRHVAVETDDRRWSAALAQHLGSETARLHTDDHLGAAALAHPLADRAHAAALRAALSGRVAVVSDHRSLAAAEAAQVDVVHLVDLVQPVGHGPVHHPCRGPRLPGDQPRQALACCGATAPLSTRHPTLAAEVATAQARCLVADLDADADRSIRSPDSACACALRAAGADVVDPVDALLASIA